MAAPLSSNEKKLYMIYFNDTLWADEKPIPQKIIEILIDRGGNAVWGEMKHGIAHSNVGKWNAMNRLVVLGWVRKRHLTKNRIRLTLTRKFYAAFFRYIRENRIIEQRGL